MAATNRADGSPIVTLRPRRTESLTESSDALVTIWEMRHEHEAAQLISLVENLARCHPASVELLHEVGCLAEIYSVAEIAAKPDFSPEYVGVNLLSF
jgi:hypothetical protein